MLSVLFKNPNFLILDEPTNDLDLPTLAVLERFLEDYQGCVLIVSHDRYFMDRLVDHLFIFEGNGEVRDFPGTYTQYRIWLKDNEKKENKWQALEQHKSKGQSTEASIIAATNEIAPITKRKIGFKEKREYEELEVEIPNLELEKEQLTLEMSDANISYDKIEIISKRLIEIAQTLEAKELRWLELSEMM